MRERSGFLGFPLYSVDAEYVAMNYEQVENGFTFKSTSDSLRVLLSTIFIFRINSVTAFQLIHQISPYGK